jgi:hypothetical protein
MPPEALAQNLKGAMKYCEVIAELLIFANDVIMLEFNR